MVAVCLSTGCAGVQKGEPEQPPLPPGSPVVKKTFEDGLAMMRRHDERGDWNVAACDETVAVFRGVAERLPVGSKARVNALYDAGVVEQRCKRVPEAKKLFQTILAEAPKFHRARTQLAVYRAEEGDLAGAIEALEQAVTDAEFKNEEALTHLAGLQMRRGSKKAGEGCDDDLACARLNLQRALAVNDAFMPAYNQLAVYHLEVARRAGGDAATPTLELAALIVSQALRKSPRYAPLHNTSGLVSVELGDLAAAAQSFASARELDPTLFEAHMNYAAVNMRFRGFVRAEEAYRKALALRPKDYEATLGLALAVRAQIGERNFDRQLAEAERLLAEAKAIAPNRPETYFNLAILIEEFKARDTGPRAVAFLKEAKGLYELFAQKAKSDARYAEHSERAAERVKDIEVKLLVANLAEEEKKKRELLRQSEDARGGVEN